MLYPKPLVKTDFFLQFVMEPRSVNIYNILTSKLNIKSDVSYESKSKSKKGGRCVGLTTKPRTCANCLEILEPQPPGTLRACPGL